MLSDWRVRLGLLLAANFIGTLFFYHPTEPVTDPRVVAVVQTLDLLMIIGYWELLRWIWTPRRNGRKSC